MITADAYGAGEADALLGRALAGVERDSYCLVGAVGHDFYEGEREGSKGFPRFTDPRLRGEAGLRRLPAHGRRALAGADRRGRVRPAAAAQPRPDRLHERRGVGGHGGAARRRPDAAARHRARPRQRLHARPARLLRALRRAAGLGDGDPRTARAVAGRARARRGAPPRRLPDHARGRLRRAVPRRRAAGPRVPEARPSRLPARGLGRGGAREARADAPGRRAPRPLAAAARLPVEPRARPGALRRADADPGAGPRTPSRSRPSARSSPRCRRRTCCPRTTSPRCARSATTPAR